MHSDKPTLWIMFLSLGALITPFLVQNPSHLCRRGGERNARRAKASRRAHASAIIAPQGGKGRAAKTARGDQKRKKKRPFLENTPRPGSACQNTSPSPNWVVLDTPIPRPPPPPTPLHPPRGASVLMGGRGCRVGGLPGACEASLAPNQSRHQRCPQTIWQSRSARTSEHAAPRLPPQPPGRNWYMGIPAPFQRGELNPHVYYEIGHFATRPPPPILPPSSSSSSLAPRRALPRFAGLPAIRRSECIARFPHVHSV